MQSRSFISLLFDYSILIFSKPDMCFNDELEFELKMHSLEQIIIEKEQEIHSLLTRLESAGTLKMQSEDQILQLVSQVHRTVKGVQKVVMEIKDPCYELKLVSLYDLFRNIYCVVVGAVRLMAEGCQHGVERNLLRFTSRDNKQEIRLTECLEQTSQLIRKRKEQEENRQRKERLYSEASAQMEIDRIYESLEAQRSSVLKTASSNAVAKLNEVKMCWMKMINDSDQMLEEAYYRKNQDREKIIDKYSKPEYISKVLKEELSQSIKLYFKDAIQKVVKKFYHDFYTRQMAKIRQDIENEKPLMQTSSQQTDIEGLNRIKQMAKEKKHYDKMVKQFAELVAEKDNMAEQYIKASRNNHLYIARIQQLEKKLLKLTPATMWQKVISETRRESLKNSRRSSFKSSFKQVENEVYPDKQSYEQNEALPNKPSSFNSSGNNNGPRMSIKNEEVEIIKKRNNYRKAYSKSKLFTKKIALTQPQGIDSKQTEQLPQVSNKSQKFIELAQQGSIKNLEGSLKLVSQKQYKDAVIQILGTAEKIKAGSRSMDSQANHSSQIKILSSKQIENIAQIIIENKEIIVVLQNLMRKIIGIQSTKAGESTEKQSCRIISNLSPQTKNNDLDQCNQKGKIADNNNLSHRQILQNDVLKVFDWKHKTGQTQKDIGYSQTQRNEKAEEANQKYFSEQDNRIACLNPAGYKTYALTSKVHRQQSIQFECKPLDCWQNHEHSKVNSFKRFEKLNIEAMSSTFGHCNKKESLVGDLNKIRINNQLQKRRKQATNSHGCHQHSMINIRQMVLQEHKENYEYDELVKSLIEICQRHHACGGNLREMIEQYFRMAVFKQSTRRLATGKSLFKRLRTSRLDTS